MEIPCRKRLAYSNTIAMIAPICIEISNVFTKASSDIFIILEASIICPVDDIGRNSVKPSMMDKIIDCMIFISLQFMF
jgi:hypothetical protein